MALIYCPKCSQPVSDKAYFCPKCGCLIFSQFNIVKCDDCGNEYKGDLHSCPVCGCPSPNINTLPQKKKSKHKAIIEVLILVAVFAFIGFSGFVAFKKMEKEQYYNNMKSVTYTMLDGAIEAEDAGNLIKNVWFNAIDKKRDTSTDKYTMQNGKFVDDFNDALDNLFSDADFIQNISKIKNNQSEVIELIKELRNPPKEYEEAYTVLKLYFDNYLKLTRMVINPKGSLKSFAEDFKTYDTDTATSYDNMILYLD